MTERLVFIAAGLLIFGSLLVFWALAFRKIRGLALGKSVSLDDLTLYSEHLKIVGRPDRIVGLGEFLIPEEWKPSARRIYHGHRLQIAVYCLLIEETFGRRPPCGAIVLEGGGPVEVPLTEELEAEVLSIAQRIREHRRRIHEEIPVRPAAGQCRGCGQRQNCSQART